MLNSHIRRTVPALLMASAISLPAAAQENLAGFYVGASAGLLTNVNFEVSPEGNDDDGGALGMRGFPLSRLDLRLGLAQVFEGRYLIAGELMASPYSILNEEVGISGMSAELDANDGYAMKVHVGRLLSDVSVIYLQGGYQWRNFEGSIAGFEDDSYYGGYGWGIGVRHMLSNTVSLQLEAFEAFYSSQTSGGAEFQPTEATVDFGLNLHF